MLVSWQTTFLCGIAAYSAVLGWLACEALDSRQTERERTWFGLAIILGLIAWSWLMVTVDPTERTPMQMIALVNGSVFLSAMAFETRQIWRRCRLARDAG